MLNSSFNLIFSENHCPLNLPDLIKLSEIIGQPPINSDNFPIINFPVPLLPYLSQFLTLI
jgi:hypothetical protein